MGVCIFLLLLVNVSFHISIIINKLKKPLQIEQDMDLR